MLSEVEVYEAAKEFTANPEWKKALREAPGAAKFRMMIAFWYSKHKDKINDKPEEMDEYTKFREFVESQLKFDELKYLSEVKCFPEGTRQYYKDLYDALPESEKKVPDVQGMDNNGNAQAAWYAQRAQEGGGMPRYEQKETSGEEGGEGKASSEEGGEKGGEGSEGDAGQGGGDAE